MNLIQTVMGNKQLQNLCLKAIGSAMRGESPVDFLKNVAKTEPKLQGYNFDDLEGTAEAICKEKGENIEQMKVEVSDFAKSYIH